MVSENVSRFKTIQDGIPEKVADTLEAWNYLEDYYDLVKVVADLCDNIANDVNDSIINPRNETPTNKATK